MLLSDQIKITVTSTVELRAALKDMLEYLEKRAAAASAVKSVLETRPEGTDVHRIRRDEWIVRLFEGREPTTDEVKRELYVYWEPLEKLRDG